MSSETNFKEYIVTLHQFDDLESFYADMETEGGNQYIPNRAVDCHIRRPVSRNTHYMLTSQEAEQLRQDARVLAVELTPTELGVERTPLWTQTSSAWSKSSSLVQGQLNWGLLRVTEGQQRSNWGTGGTTEVTGTVTVPFSGKNVDVVIMDGRMEPGHPEFAKNPNGTGGTRVIQYNWYELTSQVTGGTNGTYSYTPANPNNDYHGAVVAGVSAGNTHGWARDANLYNIYAYNADPQFDYVRTWHNNKSVNPLTGRKNPTIINCSFGYRKDVTLGSITSIVYRGITYTGPFTEAQANSYGLFTYPYLSTTYVSFVYRFEFERVDIEECIAAGIIVVFAAGNESSKIDVTGGQDYNNSVTTGGVTYLYNQGSSDSAEGAISVGAIGTQVVSDTLELKASYSSSGPGVDVFAPGSNIRSSSKSDRTPNVPDARNSSYVVGNFNGTSYAAPQVAGLLATMLEVTPAMTPAAAMTYVTSNAKTGQIGDSAGGPTDAYALQGAANRYLFAKYPTTISITANTASATPLQSVIYTITVSNVADGSLVYLTESGTSTSADFVDGLTQTRLTITSGAASWTRTVASGISGTRTSALQLRTGGYDGNIQSTATVTVADGVKPPITYVSLVGTPSTVSEGSSITFTLTTTNADPGTTVYWTTTGAVTTSDFVDGFLQGQVQIQNNGTAIIVRAVRADSFTEGTESFQLQVREGGYDTLPKITSNSITISDTSTTPAPPPPPVDPGPGGVTPTISVKVSPADYNDTRTNVVGVLGASTGGTVNAVQGYGQPISSSAVGQHEKVREIHLDNLRSDIVKAITHQTGTAPTIADVTQSDKIRSNIFSVYQTLSSQIVTNRNVVASTQIYSSPAVEKSESYQAFDGTDGSGKGWKDYAFHEITVTFLSPDDARYFFNAGSSLTFTASHSGGTTSPAAGNSQNVSWTDLLTVVTNDPYKFSRSAFYALTSTYSPVYTKYAAGPTYSDNFYRVSAKYSGTLGYGATNNAYGGASQIVFKVEFVDAYRQGDAVYYDAVDGTFTSTITENRVKGAGMGGAITVPTPPLYSTSPTNGFNESDPISSKPIYKTAGYVVTATPASVTEQSQQIELKFSATNYTKGRTITWTITAPDNTNPAWNLFDFDQTGWTASVDPNSGKKKLTKTSTNDTGDFLASTSTIYITTNPDHFTEGTETFTVVANGAADGSGGGFDSPPVTFTVTDSSKTYTPGLVVTKTPVVSPARELNAVPGQLYGAPFTITVTNTSITPWVGSLQWLRIYGMYVDISSAPSINAYRLKFASGWGTPAIADYSGSSMYVFPAGEVILSEGISASVTVEISSLATIGTNGTISLKILSDTGTVDGGGKAAGPGYNIRTVPLSYDIATATIALTVTAASVLAITFLSGQSGSVSTSVRIANTGNSKATISSFTIGPFYNGLTPSFTSPVGQIINPGSFFDVSVNYSSNAPHPNNGYLLVFEARATNSPYAAQAVSSPAYTTVTSTLAVPQLTGVYVSGTTSGQVTKQYTAYVNFNNTGNATLTVTGMTITGTNITATAIDTFPRTFGAGTSNILQFTWSRSRINASGSTASILIYSNTGGTPGNTTLYTGATLIATALTPTITTSSSNGLVSGARTNSTDWSTTFALKKLSAIFIQVTGAEPNKYIPIFPTWESGAPHPSWINSGSFNSASKPIALTLNASSSAFSTPIDSSGNSTLWQGVDTNETAAWQTGIGQHYYAIPVGLDDNGGQVWHQVPGRMGDGVNVNVNQIKFTVEIFPKPKWTVNSTVAYEGTAQQTVTITTGDDWTYVMQGCTSATTSSTSDITYLAGTTFQAEQMVNPFVFDKFDTTINGQNGPNTYASTPGTANQGGRQALAAGVYARCLVTQYKGVNYTTGYITINVLSPPMVLLNNYQNNPYSGGEDGGLIYTWSPFLENQFVSYSADGFSTTPTFKGVAVTGKWIIQRRTQASAPNTVYANCNVIAVCDDTLEIWLSGPTSSAPVAIGTATLNQQFIQQGLSIKSDGAGYVHWLLYLNNVSGPSYYAIAITIGADLATSLFYRGSGTADMLAASQS